MKINICKMLVLMYEHNLNVNELAAASDVSRVTISAVKSGKKCSHQTVCKIAKALDVDVTELLED